MINENRAGLSFGRSIGKSFRAGIGLHWMVFNQPSDYRDLYAWIPTLGVQWVPDTWFIVSVSLINPARQEYLPSGYRTIPASIAVGIGFKPSEEFLILLEAENIHNEKPKYVLGIEVKTGKSFFMRLGIIRQHYTCYSAGAGLKYRKVNIDAAVSHHPVLGFSPAVGLNFVI